MRRAAVEAIAQGWAQDPATLQLLQERASTDQHEDVRQAAVRAIAWLGSVGGNGSDSL